jgi:hypothetical protein
MNRLGTFALIAVLLGLLAAAILLAVYTWMSVDAPPMPAIGYVAMALGIIFSLALGCGLMALLFYSSRHGYDDIGYDKPYRPDHDRD